MTGSVTEHSQYECPRCGERYFAERWCPDCQGPCRRVGLAFECDCGEVHLLADLLADIGIQLNEDVLPPRLRGKLGTNV